MDKQIDEINGTVKEVHTSNKFLLKRLNQILNNPDSLDCKCASSTLLQECMLEIENLKARVVELERREKEKEDRLIAAVDELKQLKSDLEDLELTVQTDDVKLKHRADVSVLDESERKVGVNGTRRPTKAPVEDTVHKPKQSDDNSVVVKDDTEGTVGVGAEGTTASKVVRQAANYDKLKGLIGRISGETSSDPNQNVSVMKDKPEVIEQSVRKSYCGMFEWELLASSEQQIAHVSGTQEVDGVHTVFLIDISASMVPHWTQVKQFFNEFISGLEDTAIREDQNVEYVALVTFGHETKVQLRLTNDFSVIRETFGKLKLGGPSPLSSGLLMAAAAVTSADLTTVTVNGFHQGSKVILITDGEATESLIYAGPDVILPSDVEETRAVAIDVLQKMENVSVELYVVPVGAVNIDFLQLLASMGNGKILDCRSARQFSRRLHLMLNVNHLGLLAGLPYLPSGERLSDADMTDLQEIKEKYLDKLRERHESTYHEEEKSDLPKLGARVVRGPDWAYGDQDSSGPGTVVGHTRGGQKCYICWDANENIDVYNYGRHGKFDILLTDEPRQLKPGETIAVGCVVKPGSHWDPSKTNVSPSDTGSVLRLSLESGAPKALVRWNNGSLGEYTYDVDKNPEIQVCEAHHCHGVSACFRTISSKTGSSTINSQACEK